MLYASVRQRKVFVKKPSAVVQNGVNVDEISLDMDDEWSEMTTILALFTLKGKEQEIEKEVPHIFGMPLPVPTECLMYPGQLSVGFTGYVGSERIMTSMKPDSFWEVVPNGPMSGETALGPEDWPGWAELQAAVS